MLLRAASVATLLVGLMAVAESAGLATGAPEAAVSTLRRARSVDPAADGLDELEVSLRGLGFEP